MTQAILSRWVALCALLLWAACLWILLQIPPSSFTGGRILAPLALVFLALFTTAYPLLVWVWTHSAPQVLPARAALRALREAFLLATLLLAALTLSHQGLLSFWTLLLLCLGVSLLEAATLTRRLRA